MYLRIACLALFFSGCGLSLRAQPPACSNASLTGTYLYLLNGTLLTGSPSAIYAEVGKLVADGQGHVAGLAQASVSGTLVNYSLNGTYTVQANCSGSMSLAANSNITRTFNIQVGNGGGSVVLAFAGTGEVTAGQGYRTTAGSSQCGKGSFSGSYGFELNGFAEGPTSEEGQMVSDGNGNLNLNLVFNASGNVVPAAYSGTYLVLSDCTGAATLTSQSGSVNYFFAVVPNGQVLVLETDPGTTLSGVAVAQTVAPTILPDFAFGGGFYSAIYFENTGNSQVSFAVNFIGDDGNPLTVPSIAGASTTINLAPQGTAIIEAPNAGDLIQGYASMFLPGGVESYGIFRKSAAGVPDQEVIVPLSGGSSTRQNMIWDDTNYVTAVSIVNPSAVATVVTISVRDNTGVLIGSPTIALGARSKTAVVMRNLAGLAGMAGKRGSADFSVTVGNIAVLGLRFSGSEFTSIPTVNK